MSIKSKQLRNGFSSYTNEDEAYIRQNYKRKGAVAVAENLNRTTGAIQQKYYNLKNIKPISIKETTVKAKSILSGSEVRINIDSLTVKNARKLFNQLNKASIKFNIN